MTKYHIKLIDSEKEILSKIDMKMHRRSHDEAHAAYKANKEPILALLSSLGVRDVIPPQRLSYWNNPNYNCGNTKISRKEVFERNGCAGADIYTHPHFIPHLRYFLFGAELPDLVIAEFEERIGNPRWVTSSDIIPIGKFARDLTRQYRLDTSETPDEFFKLCLDMGLSLDVAESVMCDVK